jgi:hypothetical protein
MKDTEREQSLIRQYLLGELAEEQQEELERRVILNSEYKQEVLITEDELLEDFVNGALSPREQQLFIKRYSSPAQARKVKIARALKKYASGHPVPPQQPLPQRSWLDSLREFFHPKDHFGRLAVATLALLLIAGSVLAYFWISRGDRGNYAALLQLNSPEHPLPQPNAAVTSVSLSPLLLRGTGEPKTVTITKETQTVQLRLTEAASETPVFRAVLIDSAGVQVFDLKELHSRQLGQASALVLQIPVQMLRSQEYELQISERNPDGSHQPHVTYSFRVQIL